MKSKAMKRFLSLSLAVCMAFTGLCATAVPTEAASRKLTGIGLAEFGLMAYRDGWQYNYGSWGEIKNGVHRSDCSGLIYAYLCWKNNDSNPVHNYNMPRTVTAQADSASDSGPISTLPRTHGLILTINNYDHVGIYLGNDKSVDNSDYGTNMIYRTVSDYSDWIQWHKLGDVEYPTSGWYEFDGDPFYYQKGEYVINKKLKIDGVNYSFNSAGAPSPTPPNFSDGDGSSGGSTAEKDKVSIAAKTTTDLNLRKTPKVASDNLIRTLAEGASVTIIDNSNDSWYKVRTSDKTVGYVSSEYLSVTSKPKPTTKPKELNIKAYTSAGEVNVRKSANTSSDIIDNLAEGTAITITQKTNSSWYKIKLANGKTGYMYASYIKEKPTTETKPTSKPTSIKAYVTGELVNLRKSASMSASIVTQVKENTQLTVTDKSNKTWYKVKLSDKTVGYMSSDYIKEGTPEGAAKPETTSKPTSAGGYTTGEDVRIREGASTSSEIIKTVAKNTKLTITNKDNKSWYKVKLSDGTIGYMSSDYIKEGSATTPSSSKSAKTTADVNLRKSASINAQVLTVVAEGTKLTVTSTSNKSWYAVKLSSGKTGYMSSDYLKMS